MGFYHRDTQRIFLEIVRLSEVEAPQSDSANGASTSLSLTNNTENILMKMSALAPIEVEILLLFSLKSKRLERIAGLAPEKNNSKLL
jgi:hypothetical protein